MSDALLRPAAPQPNREQRRAGYKRKIKHLSLSFEGTQLDGLRCVMKSVPVGTILDLASLSAIASNMTADDMAKLSEMFDILAGALVSWNHETDYCAAHHLADCADCGCPAHGDLICDECVHHADTVTEADPPDINGVRSLDLDDALVLIMQWTQAAAGIAGGEAGPLGRPSPGGGPSPVASLPMEPSSPNPSN